MGKSKTNTNKQVSPFHLFHLKHFFQMSFKGLRKLVALYIYI